MIREKGLRTPEDDKNAFDILANEKIIPEILAKKLKEAKGMRNIIAHKYGKIDDEIIFESLTTEIEMDATEFLENIKRL